MLDRKKMYLGNFFLRQIAEIVSEKRCRRKYLKVWKIFSRKCQNDNILSDNKTMEPIFNIIKIFFI